MPLPAAESREARVYALLKGFTLNDVSGVMGTGETLPNIGNPITVENVNEDELRRLVLVKLAAECVRGEWNGLLGV